MIFSIDLYGTKRNTLILRCFIQFTCTNLYDCQKEGGDFFNLLQKEVGTKPGGNYEYNLLGFLNFDIWLHGCLAQIFTNLIFCRLQKLYMH